MNMYMYTYTITSKRVSSHPSYNIKTNYSLSRNLQIGRSTLLLSKRNRCHSTF